MLRDTLRPVAHAIRSVVGTAGLSETLARVEHALAAITEAAIVPSVSDAPQSGATAAATPERAVVAHDVNLLLHHSRGALLRGMPPGARRLLSAGCAGNWYFEWIEQTYGHVPEHLGIEFYEKQPAILPNNVTWIANTASDMSAVESSTCDLVFSGQNLEHLWPEETAGFVLEAARVLKLGGCLVVDSPNRLITAPLTWSHPQHTIELTPEEATQLLHLAGFDIRAAFGIWLCRDTRNGKILPFDPNAPCAEWSVTERLLLARDHPEESFIWWLEGVRTEREPDANGVCKFMKELFHNHWPERVQRLLVPPGHEMLPSPEGDWVVSAPQQGGAAIYGPYMPLKAGRHRVTWRLHTPPDAISPVAICDVVAEDTAEPLARHAVLPGETEVKLEFSISATTFGLQFRCLSTGGAGFSVLRHVTLEEYLV